MGCGSSQPEPTEPRVAPRPVSFVSQLSQPSSQAPQRRRLIKSGGRPDYANGGSQKFMTGHVRQEFLHDIHAALYDVQYMVIGSCALAEYGSLRETADMDVLVGGGCSKYSATELLITRTRGRMIRPPQGGISYIAPDGRHYKLNLLIDTDVELPFNVQYDGQMLKGARLATMIFLLNSKAHAWQTRTVHYENYDQKRASDAADIEFCLKCLQGQRVDHPRLRWVYSRAFWKPFLTDYPHLEILFKEAGIWVDHANTGSTTPIGVKSRLSAWGRQSGLGNRGTKVTVVPETILEESPSLAELPRISESRHQA